MSYEDQLGAAKFKADRDNLAQAVQGVCEDMEEHALGVEGMEDAPVTRWDRDLRAALGGMQDRMQEAIDHAMTMDPNAQRLLQEDEDAVKWVRDHGGLEAVLMSCGHADNRRVELCSALGIDLDTGWSDAMERMRMRLMPEGMEWPTVDGKPVVIGERLVGYGSGDDGYEVVGVRPTCGWVLVKSCDHIHRDEGPVILEWDASKCHRPEPKVLDADGVEIHVGDTVYFKETGETTTVVSPFTTRLDQCHTVECDDGFYPPEKLTHTKPERDSWEQLEKDAAMQPYAYCVGHGLYGWDDEGGTTPTNELFARDLVRRAKELAGVSE